MFGSRRKSKSKPEADTHKSGYQYVQTRNKKTGERTIEARRPKEAEDYTRRTPGAFPDENYRPEKLQYKY